MNIKRKYRYVPKAMPFRRAHRFTDSSKSGFCAFFAQIRPLLSGKRLIMSISPRTCPDVLFVRYCLKYLFRYFCNTVRAFYHSPGWGIEGAALGTLLSPDKLQRRPFLFQYGNYCRSNCGTYLTCQMNFTCIQCLFTAYQDRSRQHSLLFMRQVCLRWFLLENCFCSHLQDFGGIIWSLRYCRQFRHFFYFVNIRQGCLSRRIIIYGRTESCVKTESLVHGF